MRPGIRFSTTCVRRNNDDVIVMTHTHDSKILKLQTHILQHLKDERSLMRVSMKNQCFQISRFFHRNSREKSIKILKQQVLLDTCTNDLSTFKCC